MDYQNNPESSENMVSKLFERFDKEGVVMPPEQRSIYEAVASRVTGLVVLDIGCGTGIGTNILGREARFVWGIDREQKHIDFARQMYERNNLSGMGLIKFEVFDLSNPLSRELSRFNVITCIDVIEHIEDYAKAFETLKRFYIPGKTTLFISTPNRNADNFPQDKPLNPHHVREFTVGEFYDILVKRFQFVTLYNWDLETTVDLDTKVSPVVAKCEGGLLF